MKESQVVNNIVNQLKKSNRYFLNLHGSMYSHNGAPDFITHDLDNRFLAIEAKAPGRLPVVNQLRNAISILKSGGRYIIAYPDFDLKDIDLLDTYIVFIGDKIGESEFEPLIIENKNSTFELILT